MYLSKEARELSAAQMMPGRSISRARRMKPLLRLAPTEVCVESSLLDSLSAYNTHMPNQAPISSTISSPCFRASSSGAVSTFSCPPLMPRHSSPIST